MRLHQLGNRLTWVEFVDLLWSLFSDPESRLYRCYPPKRPDQPTDDEGGDE